MLILIKYEIGQNHILPKSLISDSIYNHKYIIYRKRKSDVKLRILTPKLIGHKIAMPIYMANGVILLNAGNILKEKLIMKLQDLGINTVYIEDDSYAIELQEMLNSKIRLELMKDIKTLFEEVKKNNKLDQTFAEKIVDKAIESLNLSENAFLYNNVSFEKNTDFQLVSHSFEVMIYSIIVGVNLRYNVKKLASLGIGALLHDIGRIFDSSEKHTTVGYDFVKKNSKIPTTAYVCLLQHHEYEDGSGFPQGLKSDKIYELSKVVGICDEYVKLLHSESAHLPNDVIEMMTAKAVTKYDHAIYRSFTKAVYCYPNGLEVKLNNNRTGIVVKQNRDLPTRPIVAIFENGKPVLLDLTTQQYQTTFIEEVIL
jgi:HD-GYP domain-containing protein (c-di-GMP phosphodiesterase class II)